MASEVFQLALLLTLKDAASGGLDRFEAKLRAAGKSGEKFHNDFEKIRRDLNRDLAIGGVGITGLATIGKGVKIAADFQASMTDLRTTIAQTGKDGKVDLQKLSEQMLRSEGVAIRLGNALPGTTEDFVQMMQVLKQNGLDTETILTGAADATANLAVSMKMLPKEVAPDLAQYGNLFKLQQKDFTSLADVISRINTSTGQTSAELVEAAKYFEGRTGSALGIKGIEDAKQYTRLFGFMGMQGMRGSMAGMGLTNFFDQYAEHADKLKDLEKSTGIKLDFFDKQGKFVGLEEVIRQMSQFDKLSEKDRAAWMQDIFGTLGKGAGNILTQAENWKKYNEVQDHTISLTEKTSEVSKNFNNQLEALTGTAKNLVVSAFEPMLGDLTEIVKWMNQTTGSVQGFVKEHPELAKYVVTFIAIGSATMAAYSGIKMVTAGIRLLRLANQFSKSEGILALLQGTNANAPQAAKNINLVGASAESATRKTGALRKDLFGLNNIFKVVLLMETIGFTWDQLSGLRQTLNEWHQVQKNLDEAGKQQATAYAGLPDDLRNAKEQADSMLRLLQGGNNEFSMAIDPRQRTWTDWYARGVGGLMGKDTEYSLFKGKPTTTEILQNEQYSARVREIEAMPFKQGLVDRTFTNAFDRVAAEIAGVKNLRERAPGLADPQVMASFRKDVMPTLGFSGEQTNFVNQLLQQAFPDSFAASMQGVASSADQFNQALSTLQQPALALTELFSGMPPQIQPAGQSIADLKAPVDQTQGSMVDIYLAANRVPGALNSIVTSVNNVSGSIDGLSSKISSWQPPAPQPAPGAVVVQPPGFAVGGHVTRSGLAFIHDGEEVVTADARPGLIAQLVQLREKDSAGSILKGSWHYSDESQGRRRPSSIFTPFEASETFVRITSQLPQDAAGRKSLGEPPITVHYAPQITINGGDEGSKEEFRSILREHSKDIERMVARGLANGRVRS